MRSDLMSRAPSLANRQGKEGGRSPARLLGRAVTDDRQSAGAADHGLRRPAAVGERAENEMKRIRIALMLGEEDEVDLDWIELQGRILAGDHLLAILLFDVLADGEDAHVGEDRLRGHHLDPS